MYLPRMLIKPVNTLFDGKKSGFVHIISLTKSAVYAIMSAPYRNETVSAAKHAILPKSVRIDKSAYSILTHFPAK